MIQRSELIESMREAIENSDRGASIRIPWQVHRDQKGYIEDRRPNANMDPYVVTKLIVDTVCGAASA